jgi:signal transduction histidine kinase
VSLSVDREILARLCKNQGWRVPTSLSRGDHAKEANREIRELAHGLMPAALSRGGLAAGVESIVQGLRVPVEVLVPEDRFPSEMSPTPTSWSRRR